MNFATGSGGCRCERSRATVALVAVAIVLARWTPPAWSRADESAAPPAVSDDLMKLTPETLRDDDYRSFVREANAAYREQRFAEAVRLYVEVVRRRPEDAVAVYNLACCYGLVGAAEPAARFLRAAWNAGFQDLTAVEQDPDFTAVRGSTAFRDTVESLRREVAAQAELIGRREEVVVPIVQTMQVISSAKIEPGRKYPLVVGLHGRGDTSAGFAAFFSEIARTRGMFLCLPEAPYALAGSGFEWYRRVEGEVGYTLDRRTWELSQRYVLAAIDSVLARTPAADPDNVFLFGFSQGGFLSYALGLRHPERFRGLIPIGGGLDPESFDPGRRERPAILVCHSPDDRVVPWEERDSALAFLRAQGWPADTLTYPGGHRLTRSLAQRIAEWIEGHEGGN